MAVLTVTVQQEYILYMKFIIYSWNRHLSFAHFIKYTNFFLVHGLSIIIYTLKTAAYFIFIVWKNNHVISLKVAYSTQHFFFIWLDSFSS